MCKGKVIGGNGSGVITHRPPNNRPGFDFHPGNIGIPLYMPGVLGAIQEYSNVELKGA